MGYRSAPRIDWSPDGSRLLTFVDGAIRVHAFDGLVVRTIAETGYLDARWLPDGRIIAVDTHALPEHFMNDGVPAGTSSERGNRLVAYQAAALSGDGSEVVALVGQQVSVIAIGPDRGLDWSPGLGSLGVAPETDRLSAALSQDGKTVAIGYETRAWDDGRSRRESGRGWLVLALAPNPTRARHTTVGYALHGAAATVLDRSWYPCVRDEGPLRFAFDRGPYARRRIAIIAPEREAGIGVIRIGAGELYPRTHLGGACVVALDDRGILAAYAYPAGVGERLLRVDYLAPQPKGASIVEILDTLWIDPDLDDVIALAFDAPGRRIACLGASGSVEVVPVP